VLASLNHPNIAAIYGVEERALIMELIEGPTLAERLALRERFRWRRRCRSQTRWPKRSNVRKDAALFTAI
jgi:hypothetical protein